MHQAMLQVLRRNDVVGRNSHHDLNVSLRYLSDHRKT